MLKEFRKFIMTGNVIDLAVAVLLAGATALVVKGFVSMIMMPIVGHFTGGAGFSEFKIVLDEAELAADGTIEVAENAILYGEWINTLINLIIVGLVLFLIVQTYNRTKKKEEAKPDVPAGPTKEEQLLMEIRDAINAKN